jgi:hypothetical protein
MREAQEIASRALCLSAVRLRASAEIYYRDARIPEGYIDFSGGPPQETPERLWQWLSASDLTRCLSPQETRWFDAPIGHLSMQDVIDCSWRHEPLTALLWALGIVDPLPPPDVQMEAADLFESTNLLRATHPFRERVRMRKPEPIAEARDSAEFWLWRARTERIVRGQGGGLPKGWDVPKLEEIVRRAAQAGEESGLFKRIDGDFPALGKAFRNLDDEGRGFMESMCRERLYGLNWICDEEGVAWDEVTCDT